ncbi:MAG: hypothetical protein E3K32_01385 [wastewater metagenome]|nr:hypothetical protein [Candidatus Loosdrechtia aerotolerans]
MKYLSRIKLPHISIRLRKPNLHTLKFLQTFRYGKEKAAWGLDIGGHALKAVKVTQTSGSLSIDEAEVIEYSSLLPNTGFQQSTHIKDAIQTFLVKHRIDSLHTLSVSVPGQLILPRFTVVPPAEKRQLKAVIQYEVRQQIPFDMKEIVWDYQQLSEFKPDMEGIEIGIFASKRATLDHILANITPLKQRVRMLQVSPLAVYNFATFDQHIDGSTIIIHAEAENTDLIIADGSHLWLRSIQHAVVTTDLVKEIQKSMEYYKSLAKDAVNFKTIVLLGNVFKNPLCVEYISNNFNYEVRVPGAVNNLKLSGKVDPAYFHENILNFGVALGLALQGVGLGRVQTNLLPLEFVKAAEISKKKPYAVATLGCLAVSLGIQYYGLQEQTKYLNNTETDNQRVLQNVREFERKYKGAETQAQTNKSALAVTSSIDSSRFFWIEALDKLVSVIPDKVFIASIQSSWVDADAIKTEETPKQAPQRFFRNKKAAPQKKPAPPQKILLMGMKGESKDPRMGFIEESVLKPIQGLTLFNQKVPAFRNVEIVPGSCRQIEQEDESGGFISFEIRWIIKTREEMRAETELLLSQTKGTSAS